MDPFWSLKYPPCPTPADAKQPQIRAQRPHQASLGPKGGIGPPPGFPGYKSLFEAGRGGNRRPLGLAASLTQRRQELLPVLVVPEDRLPLTRLKWTS
jgi:hypothetical protein